MHSIEIDSRLYHYLLDHYCRITDENKEHFVLHYNKVGVIEKRDLSEIRKWLNEFTEWHLCEELASEQPVSRFGEWNPQKKIYSLQFENPQHATLYKLTF